MLDEIAYPLPKFKSAGVDVWEWKGYSLSLNLTCIHLSMLEMKLIDAS